MKMEVDEDDIEELVNSNFVIKECPISEQVSSSSLQSSRGPAPPEDNDAPPPPPGEEWIPPPLPDSEPAPLPPSSDSEPAPPPPPEEPVASYVHPGAIPQPYIGQANVGYTVAGLEYYAAVGIEGTNATCYVQASEHGA
jgi:formin-binding protein 4